MILDQQNIFSDKQNLAQAAGSHLSTNVIDLGEHGSHPRGGVPSRDPGRGGGIPLLVQVTEDFIGGTNAKVQVVNADSADMGTGLVVVQESAAIATAQLKAGFRFSVDRIPEGTKKRYLALRYVTTGTFTAGKITAGLVLDIQSPAPPA